MKIPMNLHVHPMPDDESIQAFLYGPLVLAGRLGTENLMPENLRAEPTKPRTVPEYKGEPVSAPVLDAARSLRLNETKSLTFTAGSQSGNVELIPFYKIMDERYAIYWKL